MNLFKFLNFHNSIPKLPSFVTSVRCVLWYVSPLNHRFCCSAFQATDLKKRIESLIERDYMERDNDNTNIYIYKA